MSAINRICPIVLIALCVSTASRRPASRVPGSVDAFSPALPQLIRCRGDCSSDISRVKTMTALHVSTFDTRPTAAASSKRINRPAKQIFEVFDADMRKKIQKKQIEAQLEAKANAATMQASNRKSTSALASVVDVTVTTPENSRASMKKSPRMLDSRRIESVLPTTSIQNRKAKKMTANALSREEEAQLSRAIRALKAAIRVRDELQDPTEEQWAEACNFSVLQLRRVLILGQESRTKLVAANAGLVMQMAKRYHYELKSASDFGGGVGTILTLQDLVQEGNLGLMEAAERFEPARGFRFGTYAGHWVRQRILRSIADYSRVIRLPVHVHSMLRTIRKAKKDMEKEIGRTPSMPELAHHLEMPVEKLRMYTDSSRTVLSLEVPVSLGAVDDKRTLGERIASDAPTPEEDTEFDSLRQDIWAVIDGLGNRERDVLVSRFGLDDGTPRSVEETSMRLGISRDRVRMVEARALNKLRHPQRNYRLKEYVDDQFDEDLVNANDRFSDSTPEQIWSF